MPAPNSKLPVPISDQEGHINLTARSTTNPMNSYKIQQIHETNSTKITLWAFMAEYRFRSRQLTGRHRTSLERAFRTRIASKIKGTSNRGEEGRSNSRVALFAEVPEEAAEALLLDHAEDPSHDRRHLRSRSPRSHSSVALAV